METDCCDSKIAESAAARPVPPVGLRVYYPLALIFAYLLVAVGALDFASPRPAVGALARAMAHFMGGFFLVFSYFKLLDLPGFAQAYRTYDWIARRAPGYGLAYPFIELGLGMAYLAGYAPRLVNMLTLVVMGVSSVGVVQTLRRGERLACACLGTVFALPMTQVTLFEDLLMAVMALWALVSLGGGVHGG